MRTWLKALPPALLCLLVACGGGGGGGPPAPLAFAMAGPISDTYGDKPFTNAATGGSGTITYGSSNSAVAVVDAGGTVTITGAGTATITASDMSSQQLSYSLVVAKASQSITLTTTKTLDVIVGRSVAAPIASTVGPGQLSFTSSNPTDIGVDANTGAVLAQAAGSAQISITMAGDANHTAAQASFPVSAIAGTVQLSAWIGTADSIVTATPTDAGVGFYRSTSSTCGISSYATCPNGGFDLLGNSPITDSTVNASRQGF
jgi:hypothetical protein